MLIIKYLTKININYLFLWYNFCIFAEKVDLVMSNKRGSRGSSKSKSKVLVYNIKDTDRLERTLDLRDIVGEKPIINDIMPIIMKRLDSEHESHMAEICSRIRNHRGILYGLGLDDLCCGIDDEDYGYDPYEEIKDGYDSKRLRKLNKKLFREGNKGSKKGGKKRDKRNVYDYLAEEDDYWNNRSTMYSNDEWNDDESNYENPVKSIKFYDDINDELSVREFDNLKDFDDFCEKNGYYISSTDYNNLVHWNVIHCCLDPISLEYGAKEVLTDNSYGALYWTVSEDMPKYGGVDARVYTD